MVERMDRLRDLRSLRRSVAERDARVAKVERDEFVRKVSAAKEEHARALSDATTKRRGALDALTSQPATPMNLARMGNVNAIIDQGINEAAERSDHAKASLSEAEAALARKQDVLAQFLRREEATNSAVERMETASRRQRDAMEDDGED